MSIKSFFLKKMLKSQGVPDNQIDMVLGMVEKNPELFKKISKEIEEKVKSGQDKMYASMQVMKKYQSELQKLA